MLNSKIEEGNIMMVWQQWRFSLVVLLLGHSPVVVGGYQKKKKKKNRRNLKMLNFVGPQLPSRLHLVLPFSFILPFLLLLLHSIRF
jgi:hypothetical protein